eukprot:TRINITY_DN2090_c0_g1_i2.p1 TRINITY_DN2090_c0_g1~~TRINITY_DN2090_c0_g1_i2.p1  ORF type:complete len:141 (+),score=18.75 TRINITY_DN2090_c0_g1_i2:277-699(+)
MTALPACHAETAWTAAPRVSCLLQNTPFTLLIFWNAVEYVSCMGQSRSLNQWKACFPARKECINMCAFKSSHLNEPCPPAEQEIVTAAPVDECPLDDEMCQELDDLCDWLEPNTACCEKAMELCEGDSVTNCAIVDDLCN